MQVFPRIDAAPQAIPLRERLGLSSAAYSAAFRLTSKVGSSSPDA
jgi:hypothetical protein